MRLHAQGKYVRYAYYIADVHQRAVFPAAKGGAGAAVLVAIRRIPAVIQLKHRLQGLAANVVLIDIGVMVFCDVAVGVLLYIQVILRYGDLVMFLSLDGR